MLPRSAAMISAPLSVTSWTPIPNYSDIETEVEIDGLLDVGR